MATTLSTPQTPLPHRTTLPHRSPRRALTSSAVQRLLARVGDRAALNLAHINARLEADRRATLRELRASRRRAARAAEEERRRLERDLHDGAQQRLIALRIHLGLAAEVLAQEPQAGPHMLSELAHEAQDALDDLRQLVHHPQPPLLSQQGLPAALQVALADAPASTHLHAKGVGRHSAEVEAAVYFTCMEAFQNALKHCGSGTDVTIELHQQQGRLCFAVGDRGPGFHPAPAYRSGGLANMHERIGALGGELRISSHPARGTTISGSLPSSDVPA